MALELEPTSHVLTGRQLIVYEVALMSNEELEHIDFEHEVTIIWQDHQGLPDDLYFQVFLSPTFDSTERPVQPCRAAWYTNGDLGDEIQTMLWPLSDSDLGRIAILAVERYRQDFPKVYSKETPYEGPRPNYWAVLLST